MFKKLMWSMLFLLASGFAQAAEDFTLWQSATFTSPYADGVIATSNAITNNNGANSIKVVVNYEAGSPQPCDCEIKAVIEEELAPGIWSPIADQFQGINTGLNGGSTRVVILSPLFNANPGTDIYQAIGEGIRVSQTTGIAPDKFRVRLYLEVFSGGVGLTSLTVSGYGRKFGS